MPLMVPPQTIIFEPVHTAEWSWRARGAPVVARGLQQRGMGEWVTVPEEGWQASVVHGSPSSTGMAVCAQNPAVQVSVVHAFWSSHWLSAVQGVGGLPASGLPPSGLPASPVPPSVAAASALPSGLPASGCGPGPRGSST